MSGSSHGRFVNKEKKCNRKFDTRSKLIFQNKGRSCKPVKKNLKEGNIDNRHVVSRTRFKYKDNQF